MSRLQEYIKYHEASARIGDIDPSYKMLLYLCDRYELSVEQRYWLAWLYAMTYCGASTFYAYNEWPDYENVDVPRMHRWWDTRGRAEIICQTDRRWVRSSNQFVPAFESYRRMLSGCGQHEVFSAVTSARPSPEARYDATYKFTSQLFSMGQFALFLYLEALHTITPLDLMPTDLDLNRAWSCRNGLYYAYDMDEYISDGEAPTPLDARGATADRWAELRQTLAGLAQPPTIWQTETILCAYRKFHRGKRYIGYYLDRQALEIAKMQDHVKNGVFWDVLWQYRQETYAPQHLVEMHYPAHRLAKNGLHPSWVQAQKERTLMVIS